MFKFLKKKFKEKKGLNSIEMVIGSLVTITLFAGITDFINISNRMQNISSTMSYISKVMSNQGCLSNNPESIYVNSDGSQYYHIDYIKNKKYITTNTLYNSVTQIMKNDNIPTSEWRVYINNELLTPQTNTKVFDFREKIPIKIEIDYNWATLSKILPVGQNTLSGTFKSSQSIISTYQIRESDGSIGFQYNE